MAKHIAIIIDSLHGGGAERVCLELVRYLRSRSYVVDLLLCEFRGELLSEVPNDVNLFAIDEPNRQSSNEVIPCSIDNENIVWLTPDIPIQWSIFLFTILPNWPFFPRKIPRRRYYRVTRSSAISKYFAFRTPNLIFSILPDAFYYAVTAMEIHRLKLPIIASIRNSICSTNSSNAHQIYKKHLHNSRFVHTVSTGIAREVGLSGFLPHGKTISVYNPSCRHEIFDAATLPSGNPWIDEKQTLKHKVVLAVGRLVKQKNFRLLIEAFADVVSVESAKLIILGEGGERKRLQRKIQRLKLFKHVQLLGHCENPYSYMSRCDVFVLSSDFEGLPNVLIEALQCGCNIVSTDCPHGPKEILGNGRWGTLVPCGDREALTAAILRSLTLKQSRTRLIERAMEFTPKRVLPHYERLIDRAISEDDAN